VESRDSRVHVVQQYNNKQQSQWEFFKLISFFQINVLNPIKDYRDGSLIRLSHHKIESSSDFNTEIPVMRDTVWIFIGIDVKP